MHHVFNCKSRPDVGLKIANARSHRAERPVRARERPAVRQRSQLSKSKFKVDVSFLVRADQHDVAPDAGQH